MIRNKLSRESTHVGSDIRVVIFPNLILLALRQSWDARQRLFGFKIFQCLYVMVVGFFRGYFDSDTVLAILDEVSEIVWNDKIGALRPPGDVVEIGKCISVKGVRTRNSHPKINQHIEDNDIERGEEDILRHARSEMPRI